MDYQIAVRNGKTLIKDSFSGEIVASDTSTSKALATVLSLSESCSGIQLHFTSGLYYLDEPLELPTESMLSGSGRSTVLKPSAVFKGKDLVVSHHTNGLVVCDLVLQGAVVEGLLNGLLLHDCGDSEIRHVYARDFDGCGIDVTGGSFLNKIIGCTTSGNGKAGISLSDNLVGRGGDYVFNLVSECVSIRDKDVGFLVYESLCVNLVGCQVYQSGGHGFLVQYRSNSTCITGCRTYQCYGNGVFVDDAHEINISSNIFCWNRGHGIELSNTYWGTVSANNVIDSGGRTEPKKRGIYLRNKTRTVQVTANAIFNWPGHQPMVDGIFEADECENNQISNNNINYYTEKGVRCEGMNSQNSMNIEIAGPYVHPEEPETIHEHTEFDSIRPDAFLDLTRK